jgi:hypothetical protein
MLGAQIKKGGWHPGCSFGNARIYNQSLASQAGFIFQQLSESPQRQFKNWPPPDGLGK